MRGRPELYAQQPSDHYDALELTRLYSDHDAYEETARTFFQRSAAPAKTAPHRTDPFFGPHRTGRPIFPHRTAPHQPTIKNNDF